MNIASRISKNLGFILWTRALSIGINLVFLAVAARSLRVVDFGKLVFILATTSLMEMVFTGSTDSILVREQAQQSGTAKENFCACAFLHACFSLLVLCAAIGMAAYFRTDWVFSRGLVLAGCASAFQVLFVVPVAFFRAEENMAFEAVLITAERSLFLAGFLVVVALHGTVVPILCCLAASMACKSIAGYLWFFRRRPVLAYFPSLTRAKYFWRESLPLMGISLLFSGHWRVDLFILKAVSSAEQLGLYAASFRVMEILRVLPVDVITAAFPVFCKLAAEGGGRLNRTYGLLAKAGLSFGTFITIVGLLLADTATRLLFGPSFSGAVWPLRILLLAFPLIFLNQIHNISLTASNRQKWTFYSLLGALGFQIAIDMMLIPKGGAAVAGAGFAIGELVFLVGTSAAMLTLSMNMGTVAGVGAKLALAGLIAWVIGISTKFLPIPLRIVSVTGLFASLLLLLRVMTGRELYALQGAVSLAGHVLKGLIGQRWRGSE